jgi:hypothetical protein
MAHAEARPSPKAFPHWGPERERPLAAPACPSERLPPPQATLVLPPRAADLGIPPHAAAALPLLSGLRANVVRRIELVGRDPRPERSAARVRRPEKAPP